VLQGAESDSWRFFLAQNIGMIQHADLGDSKSPAPISDQGAFWAIFSTFR
jgi:hypothetical protein